MADDARVAEIEHLWQEVRDARRGYARSRVTSIVWNDVPWLIARVRELEADKRRLDWMDERSAEIGAIAHHFECKTCSPGAPNIRASIDDAMTAENGPFRE